MIDFIPGRLYTRMLFFLTSVAIVWFTFLPPCMCLSDPFYLRIASKGSRLHSEGLCKPCAWFWRPGSCTRGEECNHCHLCPPDSLREMKRQHRKMAKANRSLNEAQSNRYSTRRVDLQSESRFFLVGLQVLVVSSRRLLLHSPFLRLSHRYILHNFSHSHFTYISTDPSSHTCIAHVSHSLICLFRVSIWCFAAVLASLAALFRGESRILRSLPL